MYDPKTYWQERGKNYRVSADTSDELANLAKLVRHYVDPIGCICEIGTGYGRIFQFLLEQGLLNHRSYFMFDIVQSMREECYRRTGIFPALWDGKTLDHIVDGYYNLVISFSVFLHVPPKDFAVCFAEHVRVCGGFFYIATYNGGPDGLAEHCFAHDYWAEIKKHNLSVVSYDEFKDGKRANWFLRMQ